MLFQRTVSMWSKISLTANGITPNSSSEPIIVCVFPDEVCPYAKIVPFSPTNGEQRGGNAVVFKSSAQTFQAFDNFNQKLNEYAHEHYICTKTKQMTGGGRGKKEKKGITNNHFLLPSFSYTYH